MQKKIKFKAFNVCGYRLIYRRMTEYIFKSQKYIYQRLIN